MAAKRADQLRKIEIVRDYTRYAAGSALIKWGNTWVLCTASVGDKVPPFRKETGKGWVTAEYSMLPGSTPDRKARDISKLKLDSRSTEIQRLITVDCDVLQADGGTRCASITGGMVALTLAVRKLMKEGLLAENPIVRNVAAVSVGICGGKPTLDLDYAHDSTAEVDLNVVMTGDGRFVEIQGTAEREPFDDAQFDALRALAKKGIGKILAAQRMALR